MHVNMDSKLLKRKTFFILIFFFSLFLSFFLLKKIIFGMSKENGGILPFEDYKLPPLGHAISGAVGSTIANLFIYPLDMYVSLTHTVHTFI